MKQILGKLLQKDRPQEGGPLVEPMLSLTVSAGVVKAAVWELKDHTIEVLGLGTKVYSQSGSEQNFEYKTLLDNAADCIDVACQVAEVDVKKTIFGLPQSWIIEEQLIKEYDEQIEKLTQSLDLESVAYVSIPHAISYYLQYVHRTPPTALLISTSREGANISYVEQGKINETQYIPWSGGSIGKNVEKGLAQFKNLHSLPASIYLFGFGDLNSAKQDLTSYNWTATHNLSGEELKFLTKPKITLLEEHVDALSVSLVGGKDFAKQHNITGRLNIKSLEYAAMNTQMLATEDEIGEVEKVVAPLENLSEKDSEIISPTANLATPSAATNVPFGFVMNSDIHNNDPITHSIDPEGEETEAVELEEVAEAQATTPTAPNEVLSQTVIEDTLEVDSKDDDEPWEMPQKNKRFAVSPPRLPLNTRNLQKWGIVAAIVLVLFLSLGGVAAWAYWNIPKSNVTVWVKPENLEKQITVKASENSQVSLTDNTIPAQLITVELKETKTADTTGKRTTGQVAKGEVVMYNKTATEKTFPAKTELRGPNNLKFILSEEVTVASASSDITGKTNGKANVKVEASDIGPNGNIDKDVSLSLASLPKEDFEAITNNKFSGGSQKDIKVVSANDRINLSKELKAEMEMKIPQQIRGKITENDIFLDKAWLITTTLEKFNKGVNDESDTVVLETTIKANGYIIKKSDIDQIAANISTAAVPEGYELKDTTKETRTDFVSLDKSGVLSVNAVTRTSIIPKINTDEIANSIIGKKEEAATKTIMNNNKIYDVSYEHTVHLPEALLTLPHIKENISVKRGVR